MQWALPTFAPSLPSALHQSLLIEILSSFSCQHIISAFSCQNFNKKIQTYSFTLQVSLALLLPWIQYSACPISFFTDRQTTNGFPGHHEDVQRGFEHETYNCLTKHHVLRPRLAKVSGKLTASILTIFQHSHFILSCSARLSQRVKSHKLACEVLSTWSPHFHAQICDESWQPWFDRLRYISNILPQNLDEGKLQFSSIFRQALDSVV